MNTLNETAQKAYDLFSPFIKDYIYRNGWDELRRVQIDAAQEIFFTENNLLLSSETASGKTEAALFPVLSMMERESPENFEVLYISPLKSLINDQFSRMELLLDESGLPVHRWHGDVSQSHKQAFLKNPRGLLQITPESLESMLIRRANDIPRLLGNLKFIIIDEIHALMGSDRGGQILCQIQRISKLIGYSPRRIGLSATVGSPENAAEWLGNGSGRDTSAVLIQTEKISWKLGLEHFYTTDSGEEKEQNAADAFIYKATRGDKCVVFSNSREETEDVTATLRDIAKKRGEEDRFYIHHGNLSASIREEAEEVLKADEKPVTACATVTLELGIDIGKLRRIINQGSPTSVAGFLQRLGRSGRRGNPPEMLMVFREEEALPNAPLFQIIPWELLQGIAIVELYRKERWIEPALNKPFPASLLFHQSLSILAANGSMTPARLAKEVLSLSPFAAIPKEAYREFLLHMVKQNYMEQTEEKELIVGTKGEKLLTSFKFFAVFKDSEDFTVRCGSAEIGTISSTPPVGERFALAGRVWEVEEVDVARRLVYAAKVEGKMKISWPGDSGFIHTRILEKMREVLESSEDYPYLLPAAKERLSKARRLAANTGCCKNSIINLGGNSFVFFPWLGTKAFQTMKRILQRTLASKCALHDIQSGGCYYITFKSDRSVGIDILRALHEMNEKGEPTLASLVGKTECPVFDKYDACLPQDMLINAYAENRLDLKEVRYRITSLSKEL
ncbi:MAG: DEAD/DEAH box helicase [Ruminococcaceae bacterium]|nr:DEAD/DEAH box helicase [Oscillospiraceae bacterium]